MIRLKKIFRFIFPEAYDPIKKNGRLYFNKAEIGVFNVTRISVLNNPTFADVFYQKLFDIVLVDDNQKIIVKCPLALFLENENHDKQNIFLERINFKKSYLELNYIDFAELGGLPTFEPSFTISCEYEKIN